MSPEAIIGTIATGCLVMLALWLAIKGYLKARAGAARIVRRLTGGAATHRPPGDDNHQDPKP